MISKKINVEYKSLFLLFLFLPINLFSWGEIAHRMVIDIAKGYSLPESYSKITAMAQSKGYTLQQLATLPDDKKATERSHPEESFQWCSFDNIDSNQSSSSSCTSQEIRWIDTEKWHFIDTDLFPSKESFFSKENYPNAFWILHNSILILQNQNTTDDQKFYALSWLIHLVGDIHQPLHMGFKKDRGGNDLEVYLTDRNQKTNLHHIWDTELVEEYLNPNNDEESLSNQIIQDNPQKPTKETRDSIYNWTDEIKPLTLKVYQDYQDRGQEFSLSDYFQTFQPDLEKQLYLAGYRLASLFNFLFS